MLKDLFINMTILITFISLITQLLKNYSLEENNSFPIKIFFGFLSGVLGIILMLFTLPVDENTIIDFRNIPIIMSAVFGSTLTVYITGIMIALFRLMFFGFNTAALLGVVTAIINTVGCWLIARAALKIWQKWAYSTFFVLFASSITLTYLLKDKSDFLKIMLIYWCSHALVSAITYWYLNYSNTANKMYRRLQRESTKDFLTDLNNVRQFDLLLNKAINNALEKEEHLSLLMLDLDFFKKVNDTYGHKEGDYVLKELGKILKNSCREFDEISRNGGEEFSVLLLDCPSAQAQRIAERIRHNVEIHPFQLPNGKTINITVSIGIATYPDTLKDIGKIVEKADNALYSAKRTGRNRVHS
ncbi:MAG TPA: diguanylate cyclase [Desulfitobacterium dehalogenans]|uniref:Diguanylate cyclase n=1 Tax=Desulfitobacterium dehalogenans TaxID=36854 RepID=A0A7C7D9A5_9FIRM|nr:diguanylate cyclase [Desulfitobacterium dehalogenans]